MNDKIEEKIKELQIRIFEKKSELLEQRFEELDLSLEDQLRVLEAERKKWTGETEEIFPKVFDDGVFDMFDLHIHPESFSKAAYQDKSLKELQKLLEAEDFVLGQIALKSVDFDEDVADSEVQEVNKKLNKALLELWQNHYANIAVAYSFYALLDRFYKETGLVKFVMMKNSMLNLLMDYNIKFDFVSEKTGMYVAYSIKSMIDKFEQFVTSEDYRRRSQMISSVNSARTNAVSVNAVTKAKVKINEINPYEGYLVNYCSHNRENTKTVNVVKVSDVDIDLNEPKTLSQLLNEMRSWLELIKQDSESIYKTVEQELGYNIFNGQISHELTNNKMLELVKSRPNLKEYFDEADVYETIPRLFLKTSYLSIKCDERDNKVGETIQTVNWGPGVAKEVMVKTTEKTRKGRDQTKTVFDSNNNEAMNECHTNMENEREKQSSDSRELSRYLDSQSYAHGDVCANLKTLGKGAEVNVEAGVDIQAGIGDQIAKERTETAKIINKTARKQANKAVSQRDVTISEASDETTEEERQQTSRILIKNPNTDAGYVTEYKNLLKSVLMFSVLDDVHIVLSNGKHMSPRIFPISTTFSVTISYIRKHGKT